MNLEKILIVNLGGIGDIILSTYAIKLLREKYPDSRIDILVVDRCRELVEAYGYFQNVYVYPLENTFKALKILSRLRRSHYGLVLNMRTIVTWKSSFKMFLLLFMIGGKKWGGRNTENKGFYFDIKIPETYLADRPEYQYDIDLIKELGIEPGNFEIFIPSRQEDYEYTENILTKNGVTTNDFLIGINPGGQNSRRWPKEKFKELIGLILKHLSCKIIMTGSKSESDLCYELADSFENGRVINLAGKFTILQFYALFKHIDLYVSNDTGSSHICVAAGTPGVFLFGGGNLTRFSPYKNKDKYVIINKHYDCAPCEKINCVNNKCMKDITVNEVYEALKMLKDKLA